MSDFFNWIEPNPLTPEQRIAVVIDKDATLVLGLVDLARAGIGAAALPCFLGDVTANLVRLGDPDASMATELWLLTHDDLRRVSRVRAVLDGLAGALQRRKPALEGSLAAF